MEINELFPPKKIIKMFMNQSKELSADDPITSIQKLLQSFQWPFRPIDGGKEDIKKTSNPTNKISDGSMCKL